MYSGCTYYKYFFNSFKFVQFVIWKLQSFKPSPVSETSSPFPHIPKLRTATCVREELMVMFAPVVVTMETSDTAPVPQLYVQS